MCNYTDYVLNLNRPLDTSVVYDAVCQTIIYYTAEFSFGYSVYRLRHLLISQALLGDLYCFINGGAPKYSVSLIIPKSDTATINKIKAAIQAAYEEGQSKLKGNGKSVPALSAIKTPHRDGDLERPDDEAYKNAYFINANSATAPGIVDADRQPILERSEVYSGVYGRDSINL